jgi:hypothetical protein
MVSLPDVYCENGSLAPLYSKPTNMNRHLLKWLLEIKN